ncbi:hypothetical protein MA16_Dca010930 [Dendrobium catenatum]|uniref:Uncharacterized protein n=1 Tax=Dendrobium catenatum TaxID=906689 RepID=A0A2I0WVM0_9ASPA|nr:hypothetical protein MA16_Dca010930 [Dendrobium catenatum]
MGREEGKRKRKMREKKNSTDRPGRSHYRPGRSWEENPSQRGTDVSLKLDSTVVLALISPLNGVEDVAPDPYVDEPYNGLTNLVVYPSEIHDPIGNVNESVNALSDDLKDHQCDFHVGHRFEGDRISDGLDYSNDLSNGEDIDGVKEMTSPFGFLHIPWMAMAWLATFVEKIQAGKKTYPDRTSRKERDFAFPSRNPGSMSRLTAISTLPKNEKEKKKDNRSIGGYNILIGSDDESSLTVKFVEIAGVASSFVDVRLRSLDDVPFKSDRKLQHFDWKQQWEFARCEDTFLRFVSFFDQIP